MATTAVHTPSPAAQLRRQWQVIPFHRQPQVIEPEAYPGVESRHHGTKVRTCHASPQSGYRSAPGPMQIRESATPKPVLVTTPAVPLPRRIDRETGQALESLAHAVEYLIDQGLVASTEPGTLDAHMGDMQAVSLLKRHSRELYLSLPERRPLWKRMTAGVRMERPAVVFPM